MTQKIKPQKEYYIYIPLKVHIQETESETHIDRRIKTYKKNIDEALDRAHQLLNKCQCRKDAEKEKDKNKSKKADYSNF